MVEKVPKQWRRRVASAHAVKLAARNHIPEREFSIAKVSAVSEAAHSWLAGVVEACGRLRVPVDISDSDLCELAEAKAREAMDLAGGWAVNHEIGALWAEFGGRISGEWGLMMNAGAVRERLERFAAGYGLPCPALPYYTRAGKRAGVEDGPAISRMTCPLWWRRGLRKIQARELEAAAIRLGYVSRGIEIYASDATVDRRQQQNRRNAAALAAVTARNLETDEEVRLSELAAASVANPVIRRGELMARIAGFEFVAEKMGHVAEFVTLTCPSAYHARRIQGGKPVENEKWNKATPREAQSYLTKLWANARAALWRRGIRPYGFRISEPHHDGTPHWHLLLFIDPVLSVGRAAVGRFRAILRRYGLRQDGREKGARENRVKFIKIEPGQGGAAGYVAKYVSKNIDGFQVQADLEGMPAVDSSRRVAAWAAAWGIRQFQQIGGPPVGVWRELRRLPAGGEYSDKVEAARKAADCGPKARMRDGPEARRSAEHWADYVGIMGGPVVRRDALPVRLAYTREGERWDFAGALPCPAPLTRYGEVSPGVVYGVRDVAKDRAWASARGRWEIKRKGGGNVGTSVGASVGDMGGLRGNGRAGVGIGEGLEVIKRKGAGSVDSVFVLDVVANGNAGNSFSSEGLEGGGSYYGDEKRELQIIGVDGAASGHGGGLGFAFDVAPDFSAPRTRGNNCSRGGWPDASRLVGSARHPGQLAGLALVALSAALNSPEKTALCIGDGGKYGLVAKGFTSEIQHHGGAEFAYGADASGAGGEDHRRSGGHHRGNGGSHTPAGRPVGPG